MQDISIITVNFRSDDHLKHLIASVRHHLNDLSWEMIVVNHDPDVSLDHLADGNRLRVFMEPNHGFAAGCNLGIKEASGKYILLLNPDIELVDGSVGTLLEHMDRDTKVGIAGGRLLNPDGSTQPSVRRFPAVLDQLLILLKLPHVFPRLIDAYLLPHFHYEKTQDVDQVMGAFFLIRRSVIEKIGLLDQGFFYWFEEVDYCKRARDAGFVVRYYHDVLAKHMGGGSFKRVRIKDKQAVIRRSVRRYIRKHFGWRAAMLFTFANPLFWLLGRLADFFKRY